MALEIAVNGIRVSTRMHENEKGRILFVHGMWMGGWVWENILKYFAAAKYSTFVIEKNRGDSFHELLENVQAIASAVRRRGLPFYIVGHSLGGLIALKCSADRVVAIAPAPPHGVFFKSPASMRLLRRWGTLFRIFTNRSFIPKREDLLDFVLNEVEYPEATLPLLEEDSGRVAKEIIVGKVKVQKNFTPTTLIACLDDHLFTKEMVYETAKKMAARYDIVLGGHCPMLGKKEERAELAEVLLSWLER